MFTWDLLAQKWPGKLIFVCLNQFFFFLHQGVQMLRHEKPDAKENLCLCGFGGVAHLSTLNEFGKKLLVLLLFRVDWLAVL